MDLTNKEALSSRQFFEKVRPSEDYEQFWIRYKPERVVRMRLSRVTDKQRAMFWLIGFCMLAGIVGLCIAYGWIAYALAVAGFLTLLCAIKLHYMLYPTHVTLNDEGMQLHWLRSFCNVSSGVIRWDRITHVSMAKRKHFTGTESTLEFNLVASGMSEKARFGYQLIAPELSSGWFRGDRCKVMLRLDGIASSDDRKRLQLALKRFLPSYSIDATVSDELSLGLKVESYTDLWMDALNAGKQRIREEPLTDGIHVMDGAYEIVSQIGAGGQALVYEAAARTDPNAQSGKTVVLKEFILPAHAGAAVRKRVLENIQHEADILKQLKHPNIVKLLEFFVEDQRAYLVLERIHGPTLKQIVEKSGPVKEAQCVLYGLQMCELLAYLHDKKVVHRDFTPDNLILAYGDILKLIDFNVATQLEADTTKTVVGKHAYIPPEQFRGKATQQSDIYALGGTLYFLSTGQDPEPIEVSHPRETNSALSEGFDAVVARATAIDLKERYNDCVKLREDLQLLKQLYAL